MAKFNFGYSKDQVELANQNTLNNHFYSQNSNIWIKPDEQADLRLRYGVIQNSQIENVNEKDSLDLTDTYNSSTGCVAISWLMNNNNGCVANELLSSSYEYNREGQKTHNVKDRGQQYVTNSTVPNVRLTSPFIWTGDNGKSCGFNYVPPNNSIAIIGSRENSQPLIMGYVPSNASVLYPCLKPGEISIAGYGNNYIHWSQSDKISIYCKANAGEADRDDYDYESDRDKAQKNVANCELEININANNRFIEIKANEEPDDSVNNTSETNKNSYNEKEVNGKQFTKILISPTDIEIRTTDEKDNETYLKISPTEIQQYVRHLNESAEVTTTKDEVKFIIRDEEGKERQEGNATKSNLTTNIINENEETTHTVNMQQTLLQHTINTPNTKYKSVVSDNQGAYNWDNESDDTHTSIACGTFLNSITLAQQKNNKIGTCTITPDTVVNQVNNTANNKKTYTEVTEDSIVQHIKTSNNETYYKNDAENIKVKTKTYIVEAEEVYIASSKHTTLWSDNNLNIAVPSEGGFNDLTIENDNNNNVIKRNGNYIERKTLDGDTIQLNLQHDPTDTSSRHKQKRDKNNSQVNSDYTLNIGGCDITIAGNEHINHGTVIDSDDVG